MLAPVHDQASYVHKRLQVDAKTFQKNFNVSSQNERASAGQPPQPLSSPMLSTVHCLMHIPLMHEPYTMTGLPLPKPHAHFIGASFMLDGLHVLATADLHGGHPEGVGLVQRVCSRRCHHGLPPGGSTADFAVPSASQA